MGRKPTEIEFIKVYEPDIERMIKALEVVRDLPISKDTDTEEIK